jgi:hypothetical protein
MLKRIFLLLSLISGLFLLSGCNSTVQANLDVEFTLSVGQSARIASEAMDIKFIDVTADSRCQTGVQCPWAGEVSCEVTITKDGDKNNIFLTQMGLTDNTAEYTYHNYTITFSVSPYPEAGKEIKKGDYRLTMKISK